MVGTAFLCRVVACLVLLLASVAQAQAPRTIAYQGYLTSNTGVPVNSPPAVSMVFSLYSAASGGAALWTETQPSVVVTKGVFNVVLGSVTPIPLAFDAPYYLGVTAGADAEMMPRQALAASPYAFRAAKADGLAATATVPGSQVTGPISVAALGRRSVPSNFGCTLVSGTVLQCSDVVGAQTCSTSAPDCARLPSGPCRDFCIPNTGLTWFFNPVVLGAPGALTLDQTTRAIVCKATTVPAVVDMELRVQGLAIATGAMNHLVVIDEGSTWKIVAQPTLHGEYQASVGGSYVPELFLKSQTTTGACFLLANTSFNVRFLEGQLGGLGDQ